MNSSNQHIIRLNRGMVFVQSNKLRAWRAQTGRPEFRAPTPKEKPDAVTRCGNIHMSPSTGGQRQEDPWSKLLGYWETLSQVIMTTVQTVRGEDAWRLLLSSVCPHTGKFICTHININTHTHNHSTSPQPQQYTKTSTWKGLTESHWLAS